jgi:membrane-bound lytic murein transglycosylase B
MRTLAACVCVALLCLLTTAAAQASDQTLRQTIRQQERQFKPDAKAFDKAVANADTTQKLIATKAPAQKLVTDAGTYTNAVAAEQASSSRVRRGRQVLLKALGEFSSGLNDYVAGITQLEQNQGDATVKKTLNSAVRKLVRASRNSTRAGKLIGMRL